MISTGARHAEVRRGTRRVVLVSRLSWFQELLARHGTREQARFFLQNRNQTIEEAEQQDQQFQQALRTVLGAIPPEWRRSRLDRGDLDRFLFEPDDIVVVIGQDGLVANVAKYLQGQPVVGVNPSPDHFDGVLVKCTPDSAADWFADLNAGRARLERRTMVEAELDDGQRLLALNELFVGHRSHQSARYEITFEGQDEYQSSSGIVVATGTGATGWASSIARDRQESAPHLPGVDSSWLVFFVREAWPSKFTGTSLTQGIVADSPLQITSRINDGGVIFGDGIESDQLAFDWGQRVTIQRAGEQLFLAG